MVTWQPYLDPYFASIQLSSMCSIDENLYLMRCPLICFYAVEYHLPHRVARQFGLRQEFPVEPFSTSIELHKFDRQRQKKVTDFETHHRDYIDEWDQQGDLNYENDQAHTNYNFRRYLIWYSGVTRCKLKGQWTTGNSCKIFL
ncbi:serine/threonine-protein phosphatase 7 long form homolog [Zea mays]|uniref:serine/threonine-protein phosphatase 7 long form homolog n=1 Tax=Zea mays TaxID=4577 RepID=UPI0016520AFF|nr:serine/threonine-protein phosphatase 7 long form homolog [Zea mays]